MKILSLGWGVQSYTLAVMVALGDFEPFDFAVWSDTLHESSATYDFIAHSRAWLEERGIKFANVVNPTGGLFVGIENKGQTQIPLFTLSPSGKKGQLRRSCTHRWKIVPVRRLLQANRNGERVEQWFGISTDESYRMRDSDVQYITHRYPLIEMGMSRSDCVRYLQSHGLAVPQRSSCVFCPYHSPAEWRNVSQNPRDWKIALRADAAIRHMRPGFRSFIHPDRVPLADVDLRTQEEKGQLRLWDEECTGLCGL